MIFEIYCDGSTRNNGYENSVGGWGYVVLESGKEIISQSGSVIDGATNQRMELLAAIESIGFVMMNYAVPNVDKVVVYTDSAYLHNCYKQKWYVNWQKNGWKNAKKQPVANQDLWERLIKWFETPEITFEKTKGHAGVEWNEYVDTLAQTASQRAKEAICKQ